MGSPKVSLPTLMTLVHSGKNVSAVKMLVYNSEHPAESCENLNMFLLDSLFLVSKQHKWKSAWDLTEKEKEKHKDKKKRKKSLVQIQQGLLDLMNIRLRPFDILPLFWRSRTQRYKEISPLCKYFNQ